MVDMYATYMLKYVEGSQNGSQNSTGFVFGATQLRHASSSDVRLSAWVLSAWRVRHACSPVVGRCWSANHILECFGDIFNF